MWIELDYGDGTYHLININKLSDIQFNPANPKTRKPSNLTFYYAADPTAEDALEWPCATKEEYDGISKSILLPHVGMLVLHKRKAVSDVKTDPDTPTLPPV